MEFKVKNAQFKALSPRTAHRLRTAEEKESDRVPPLSGCVCVFHCILNFTVSSVGAWRYHKTEDETEWEKRNDLKFQLNQFSWSKLFSSFEDTRRRTDLVLRRWEWRKHEEHGRNERQRIEKRFDFDQKINQISNKRLPLLQFKSNKFHHLMPYFGFDPFLDFFFFLFYVFFICFRWSWHWLRFGRRRNSINRLRITAANMGKLVLWLAVNLKESISFSSSPCTRDQLSVGWKR